MSNAIVNLLNAEEWWRCSHLLKTSPDLILPQFLILKSKLIIGKLLWNFPEYTIEKSNSPFHPALLSRSLSSVPPWTEAILLSLLNPCGNLFLLLSIKLICPSLLPPNFHSCCTTSTYQPHSPFFGTFPYFFNKILHSEFLNSKFWTNNQFCHLPLLKKVWTYPQ